MDALDSLLAGSKPNASFIGPDQLGTLAPPTRANPQGEQPDALDALLATPKPAPEPGLGLGDTLGNIASSIGYGVTNLPNLGADLIEKVAPLAPNAPVTNADIARDEFHKRAQAATASDLANPAFGLGVAAQIAHALHAAPAAVVAANQPAPIDYRNLNPNGPAGTALAAMETAARGVVKTPLDVTAGGLSLADLVGLDHPQDAIFAGEQNADQDAATRAAESAHPITTAGTGIATNLATFAGMPEADLGTLTVKAEQFAAEHPGVLGKMTQYLARSVANTPRAAVAGGIPQGEDAAQQTLANGGTLPQAYGEAAANTGLGTLAFELPASLGGPAPARAVGGAAVQAAANYGQQAASHAIAPQVFPEAQVSPEAAGLGALFGLLGGHGEAPAVEAPRAAEPVPALDTIAAKMRAELKAQGLSDAQIDAILNPAPEGATPTLPAPVVHVDTAGNAATQAQTDAARRAAETLGLTPDVLKAQAARATGAEAAAPAPAPAPREPLALPPPVVQVDRAGTARTSADFMRELAAAQQAARDRAAMGLTPDVERAQAARNAPALAAQEQERANPSPSTIDELLAEVEGRQHAPEGAPEPEHGIPAPAPEKVQNYFANLPKEIGWEQIGGKLLRAGSELDQGENAMRSAGGSNTGDVIGRTTWIPKVGGDGRPSAFWRMRPDTRLTEAQAHEAFRKVAAGEPLRPIEQRFIDYARQSAHEYAQAEAEDTARFEAEQNEADDLERQRAIEELRNESARFATADHGEAFTLAQWIRRAHDAGVPRELVGVAMNHDDWTQRLSALIREQEHGADQGTTVVGDERGVPPDRQGQAAAVRESPGETGQAASEGARADLFPAATAREQVAAASRAKDDARNGNTGRVIPGFEGTHLGATPHGEAPEQARIPEDDTPDAPLDIRYGKRRIPAAIGSKPKPSDIPESSGIEVTEHTEGDVPPEIAELQGRHAARTDNAAMAEHLRQANVEQGEREARERGLRGAVGDTIGDHRVTFVHDEEGLPEEVRARLGNLHKGNVRYGLFSSKGDVYLFTKNVRTPERAAWTAAHEIAGHEGIRGLVEALTKGDGKLGGVRLGGRTPLDALHAAMDLARQNPTVSKIADAIAKQRGMNDAHLATEEALAELAAATRTGRFDEIARKYGVEVPAGVRAGVQGAIKNFVARLRKILNTIYAKLTGKPETFSDEDVHALLADAWSQVHGEARGVDDVLDSSEPDQTDTPEFRRWFGDSKVVDAQGRPLVVYHGTSDEITAFDRRKLGSRESAFFFTANPDSAREYGGKLIPVYLKADRFIDLDANYRDANGIEYNVDSPEFRARFDGYSVDKGEPWNEYVVFRPEQIKSATENRGTFDPNDASILHSAPSRVENAHASADSLREELRQSPVGKELLALEKAGKLSLHDTLGRTEGGKPIAGAYDPRTGMAHLAADQIPRGQALGVALHELGGHKGLPEMLGKEGFARAAADLKAVAAGKGPQAEIVKRAMRRAGGDDEELVAYSIEEAVKEGHAWKQTGKLNTALVRIFNKLRAWFAQTAIGKKLGVKLRPTDLVELAKASVRKMAGGETVESAGEAAPAYSHPEESRAEPAEEPTLTGIKNAQTAKERAERGLDELHAEGKRSYGAVWDSAEATLRNDPQAGLRLADEIARKPRALTPEEQVVLAQDRARIFVDRHKAAEAVNAAVKGGDAKAEAVARDRLFRANQQLEISDIAARQSGYEQGLALSVRRMMAELDYSREGMETRLQAAKGKPLDVEELNKLRDLHQKMQDVEAKMAGRTEAKQARQKETKAQLQEQLRLFRDQLREADSRRDAIRQKQLRKQIAELARRIVEGDYSKAQRTPIQYNEETRKLEAERNRLRGTFEEMAAKAERMNRGPVKKTLSMIHDLQMASILLSLHVYKKLAYAVGGGHAMSLLADATRSGARHVPGIKGIAEQSPQYGRGLDLAAMRARAQGIKEAPKEVVNQLRYGMATREAAHGMGRGFSDEYFTFAGTLADAIKTPGLHNKAAETTRALAGYVGRSHAAEKEFLAQPEFREGIVRQTQFLMRQMEKAGKSKEEIAQEMSSESTQAAIGAKALERAFESKMQGKNDFSRSVDAMIGTLDRSQNAGANFLGFMLKTIFPIRKVGVNVVVQGTSLMGGGLKALAAALKKGDMTPERADYIMKNIGQQGAGALLLALGAIYYNQFGGVPGVFSKKDQPKHRDELGNVIKPGEANGFGTEAFHGAPAAMIQVGASMAQVFEKEHGKRDGLDLALNVAARPTLAWLVRTTPYTDTIRRMTNTAEYGRGRKEGPLGAVGEISGQTARGILVPGVVQQAAAASDPYKGFRRPRNFGEDLKLGIPGLREQVPKERR